MRRIGRTTLLAAIGLGMTLCSTACERQNEAPQPRVPPEIADAPPPPPPPPPEAKPPPKNDPAPAAAGLADPEAGRADYQLVCAACHGPTGDGDGPVAQSLEPKPARHSDGAYMNPLTDDYLFQIIKFGGQRVGKSALMAPWGGALSDQQIENVIAFIRTLADPPYRP
jgi:mono/diheme cytochrome c family protein